jgi:mannose-6-phosphate isomerase-like protein (cupin superfamily)
MHGNRYHLVAAALAITVCTQAWPQNAEQKTYASAADIAALMAKFEAAKQPGTPMNGAALLQLAPYAANLEYRTSVGPAAVHENEAELIVVIDGSGSIVIGGRLLGQARRNAENLTGTGIEGGAVQKVAKGDVLIIPENTAHWFNAINGKLVLMSLHLPHPMGNAPD